MKLNIGCGGRKLDGYVNVDAEPTVKPDVLADLGGPWPFEDNSVDEVVASHILEHLTTPQLFNVMRELYRVCKNGAVTHIAVPHPRSDLYLNDPTHQRPVMPGTMVLFSKRMLEARAAEGVYLTPFWKILSVDFDFDTKVLYRFYDEYAHLDPEAAMKAERSLFNVVQEIQMRITAVKP